MQIKSKILIVDDELSILRFMQRLLEQDGHTCSTAQSVDEAKALMKSEPVDLVITDLKMPNESGMDLLKFSSEFFPEVGRMMMTGYSSMEIAQNVLQIGVYGYLIKPLDSQMVRIAIQNALRHMLLENQMHACLKESKKELLIKNHTLEAVLDNIDIGVALVDNNLKVLNINRTLELMFSVDKGYKQQCCFSIISQGQQNFPCADCPMQQAFETKLPVHKDRMVQTSDGLREFKISALPIGEDKRKGLLIYHDVTDMMQSQQVISESNKMMAIGQLAAGIAHEINTPTQYLGDNIDYLQDVFEELRPLLIKNMKICDQSAVDNTAFTTSCRELQEEAKSNDLDFLLEEVPKAIDQSQDGVKRIGDIVKAMKEFSHPGEDKKSPTNINKLITSTILVCKNEWKYVAEVESDFDKNLPLFNCLQSEISQVILILVVNAAHAIEDFLGSSPARMGKIVITTQKNSQGEIKITIRDTGKGIPDEIGNKVFNAFFTTKKRGKGTGQGLYLAKKIVSEKHNGSLSFTSEKGKGTEFTILFPAHSES